MLIHRIGEPAFDERRSDNRVVVRFRVNRQPDQAWISSFKAHAASSALGATGAVFNGNDAAVELAKPKSMAELSTALDCFIECATSGSDPGERSREHRGRYPLHHRGASEEGARPRLRLIATESRRGPDGTRVSEG